MSIAFKKYVNIISGVGGGAGVRQRDLIGRLITSNKLAPPDKVLEFTGADGVLTYFGAASTEYKRAVDYFGYISPSISNAKKISFSRWSETGNGAYVIGNNDAKLLASFTAVTAGAFDITVNGVVTHIVGVNLSAAATMAAVATALQTAVATAIVGSTVQFALDGPNRFTLQLPVAQVGAISITPVSVGAQDVATKLGWTVATNAIFAGGVTAQVALDAVQKSIAITDNFASLLFIDDLDQTETTSVATYIDSLNVRFMFLEGVTRANAAVWSAAMITLAGLGLTLMDAVAYPTQWPDQIPMTILAATDYNKRNGVQSYMYRQLQNLTPLVTDDANSDALDALRVNYYGQTATAGQQISFYQRGKLMGLPTDPVDMNVYANEIWLKDYAGAQIMALQLSVSRVPANDTGRAMILAQLQTPIDAALFNGVISVGKTLTSTQKIYIEQQTGDDLAWREVENVGYILTCTINQVVQPDSSIEYEANYTLIYSKDDTIRKVNGTHQLI